MVLGEPRLHARYFAFFKTKCAARFAGEFAVDFSELHADQGFDTKLRGNRRCDEFVGRGDGSAPVAARLMLRHQVAGRLRNRRNNQRLHKLRVPSFKLRAWVRCQRREREVQVIE